MLLQGCDEVSSCFMVFCVYRNILRFTRGEEGARGGLGGGGGVESRSFSVHANSRTIDIKVAAIISTLLFQPL